MSDINGNAREKLTLSPADAAAVDSLLDIDSPVDTARKQRAEQWLNVLDAAPVPAGAPDLLQRTLNAVSAADRLQLPARRATEDQPIHYGRWRRRLSELGAMGIAAMLFIAVLLSGLAQMKKSQIRVACVNNLQKMSVAFNAYAAGSGAQALPMVALPSNANWLHGTADGARNNASHLMALVDGGFIPLNAFYCPGASPANPVANTSAPSDAAPLGYSYRLISAPIRPRWDGQASTIIITDRNPVFADPGRQGAENGNSDNHDRHGNNILRADGSVVWSTSPSAGPDHDNIWTIGSGKDRLLTYKGTELPANAADVFVCP